jgi:low affinity Fe/Cu permease
MDDITLKLSLSDRFSRTAQWTSQQCGRAYTFVAAIVIIAAWAVSGPAFHYSDTWQLIINTGTTIYCDPAEIGRTDPCERERP